MIAQILASTSVHMLHQRRYAAGLYECFTCKNVNPRDGLGCHFCSVCACDDCGVICKPDDYGCGDLLCAGCTENRQQDEGERAEQELFTSYWEGTAPDYVYENMARRAG